MKEFFIGYDKILERAAQLADLSIKSAKYPPFNVKKVSQDNYIIELAVAGFCKNNLDITTKDGSLVVTGKVDTVPEGEYIFKGISTKPFSRSFALSDTIEVKSAKLTNGLLKIFLESFVKGEEPNKVDIQED